jgi:uncharacterized protein YndB with AHSA1/START domain
MVETSANRMTLTLPSDREIAVQRTFDAPRSLVFEAMTSCEHLARWWGPRHLTLASCEMEFRPGGAYRFVQQAPDGTIHPFKGEYREIAAPERVVLTQIYEPYPDQEALVSTTLAEKDGKTTLSQTLRFASSEARDGMIASGMESGEAESFDRLDELLAELSSKAAPVAELAVTREFDAPRDLVWKAWTEPERLAQWWGPSGSEIRVKGLDLRAGGFFLYSMKTPNGPEMWGKFVYREVNPQDCLVFVNCFSDANGGVTRNPWIAGWPLEILNTLTLTEHDGKTALTLRGGPINASAEELQTFAAGVSGMRQGFAGTFKQLDRYLAEALARA